MICRPKASTTRDERFSRNRCIQSASYWHNPSFVSFSLVEDSNFWSRTASGAQAHLAAAPFPGLSRWRKSSYHGVPWPRPMSSWSSECWLVRPCRSPLRTISAQCASGLRSLCPVPPIVCHRTFPWTFDSSLHAPLSPSRRGMPVSFVQSLVWLPGVSAFCLQRFLAPCAALGARS